MRHKLIEPRPDKNILSYKTKKFITEKKRNVYYLKFNNSLPLYDPYDRYFDDNIPYLGTNKYNKETNNDKIN